MANVAVFDMNETMLSLASVKEMWDRHIPGAHREWFARLLHLSLVSNAIGAYVDFSRLGGAALAYVCEAHSYTAIDQARADLTGAMANLEAHPDVAAGLQRLKDQGWTLATLTNSTRAAAEGALASTDLARFFDMVLTVEAVERFKPDPAPYRMAAEALESPIESVWMVASHDWDLAGARRVGMQTAFVRRPNLPWAPIYDPPEVEVVDFGELAEQLLAT